MQNRARYLLRNADNISTIRTNSVLYYESILPSAIRAWNDLPNTIRNSTSLINSNAIYQNKGQNLQTISITAEEYHKYSMHDYVWSVVLYNSTCLRKALLKVPCALVVSQKRRNTSYLIAKTITKSVTELCLIFSTFQLNPCSLETPDSQRKKIQTFLKLFINSLLRQGALTIILTHLAYIANGKKTCYIVQQFHWANKRDVTLRHL